MASKVATPTQACLSPSADAVLWCKPQKRGLVWVGGFGCFGNGAKDGLHRLSAIHFGVLR